MAVGAGYLGLAAAPTLAFACAASVLGGAGNGVQWVTAISAVQELTAQGMQARVMSVLESIGAAMPGIGFALGGAIAAVASPRMTFLVAGIGAVAIAAAATVALGGDWVERAERPGSSRLDADDGVVLELLPGGNPSQPDREVER
jgi:MFS family permease